MPQLSIGAAIRRLAEHEPDSVCLRVGREAVTRAELDLVSERLARRWRAEGLQVDEVVAVSLAPSVDFVVACVAAWKAGATVLPLRLPAGAERDAVLALAAPALIVDAPLDRDQGAAGPLPDLAATSWKAVASSGSTGRPKLIRATAAARIDPDAAAAGFVPRRAVQLVAAPIAHAASFVYAMRGLMTGHQLVVMPQSDTWFDAGEWLRLVGDDGVTWAPLNPQLMRDIWRHPDRPTTDVSSLESVLHVGARCPDDLKRDWLDWLGPERVVEVYAGSESQGVACIDGREWLAHPGSVGRGVGGTEFRVVRSAGDRAGTWADPGEPGEIVMRRPGTAYAYVGTDADSPATGARTIEGEPDWHTLGDVGHVDEQGYLYVGDRLVDLVPTAAGPVQPADVEAVLDAHPAVRSSAVTGHDGLLRATVQLVAGSEVTPAELAAWTADRLPARLRPATWQVVDTAVRDDAGKVRRSTYG